MSDLPLSVKHFLQTRRTALPRLAGAALLGLLLALPGLLLALPGAGVSAVSQDVPALAAEPHHDQTLKLVNYFVERYHYRKTRLDDPLSSQILDRYLDTLDANRSYFLASDIESFEPFRYELDDYLGAHDTDPLFTIFNSYRTRVLDRIDYALGLLDQPFDFSVDEVYPFDRTEAPWAIDSADINDLWRRRVKNDYLVLKLEGKAPQEIIKTLRQRYQQQKRRVLQISSQDVFQTLVNAYMSAIEPHTGYFSPRATENFKIRMSLSLEGIGAVLQTQNEFTVILRVVPGGPAELEGSLRSGDRIVGVGQGDTDPVVDVIGWRLDDVVDLIRGPKGSVVRLQIRPDPKTGNTESRILALTRDEIKLEEQAAQSSLLEVRGAENVRRIGVIDIPTFYVDFDARARGDSDYRSTTRDVRRLIGELESEGMDGLIIDLRGNGGGALAEATALTGLFIASGPVVQVRDARGRTRVNRDPSGDIAYSGPLAVIVDRDSASASEIFSGAIQDYQRGLIIGESTYGKGTVQNLIDLDRYSQDPEQPLGQLKLTIAQFFRVSGASTQHRGVVPDIVLPGRGADLPYGEKALENALPFAQIDSTAFSSYSVENPGYDLDQLRELHSQRIRSDPDFAYLAGLREIDIPLAQAIEISLMESQRQKDRDQRENEQQRILDTLKQAHGYDGDSEDASQELPRDAVLLESARVLADMSFGAFGGRLVVQRVAPKVSPLSDADADTTSAGQ
ncbi:MAG: carboxy terminal-processing peptidase [Arenicellales bacterium]|nr:carboxy terminal-processing peptidase [Arenicellales bacterium]MDP6919611.1 carboxy terminal-processing peptidase [Arenicellales bacterium]